MSVVAVVAFNRGATLPGAGTAIIALLPVIVAALAVPVLGDRRPNDGGCCRIKRALRGVAMNSSRAGIFSRHDIGKTHARFLAPDWPFKTARLPT
jgi:hypothetical protein